MGSYQTQELAKLYGQKMYLYIVYIYNNIISCFSFFPSSHLPLFYIYRTDWEYNKVIISSNNDLYICNKCPTP